MALRGGKIQVTLFGLFVLLLVVSSARGGDPAGTPRDAAPTAVCADDPYEPDSTWEQAKPIQVEEAQTHLHCDPDWVTFDLYGYGRTPVYVAETRNLVGGADTILSLGVKVSGKYVEHFLEIARDDNGGEGLASRIVFDGAAQRMYLGILEAGDQYGSGKGYDVGIRCLSNCGALGDVLFIPAVSHARGRNGTLFQSDLRLFNAGDVLLRVDLVFTPTDQDGRSARISRTVTVAPRETLEITDVVATLFGQAVGAGSLEIRPMGGDVFAYTRLYDAAGASGTFAEYVPAESLSSSAAPGETLHLIALSKADDVRTNVGFCETTGGRVTVSLTLYDRLGTRLGSKSYELPPWGHHQVNDVFAEVGAPPQEDARASLRVTGGGQLLGYATVIDNRSSDVDWRRAELVSYNGAWLPVGSLGDPGQRTDLRIVNVGPAPQTFGIRLPGRPREDLARYTVDPGATLALDDVFRAAGLPAGGLLTVSSSYLLNAQPYVLTCRTYVPAVSGTRGESILPRLPYPRRLQAFPGVSVTGSRFSLGFANLEKVPVSVTVGLVAADGRSLGTKTYALASGDPISEPGSFLQVADVFGELGVGACAGCRVEVDVPPLRSVLVWGRLVDTSSNDPLHLPGFTLVDARSSPSPETVKLPGGAQLRFVRFAPGDDAIGSPSDQLGRDADEGRHAVRLPRPYRLGVTEVTEAEWDAVMGGSRTRNVPVVNVSWDEIAGPDGFLDRLNAHLRATGQSGLGAVRLPTEAEWEVAARDLGLDPFVYALYACDMSCGPCPNAEDYGWWCGNSGGAGPKPVAGKRANVLSGLFDMHGNAWEWVSDWYAPFTAESQVDPKGPSTGTERVIRGGGWNSELKLCRSANRFKYPPDARYDYVGFRVAASKD